MYMYIVYYVYRFTTPPHTPHTHHAASDACPGQDLAPGAFLLHVVWEALWTRGIPRERLQGILSGVLL